MIEADSGTFKLNLDNGIVEQKPTAEYLSGKTLTVTLDGKSQTITLPEIKPVAGDDSNGTKTAEAFAAALNSQLEKAFGQRPGKREPGRAEPCPSRPAKALPWPSPPPARTWAMYWALAPA